MKTILKHLPLSLLVMTAMAACGPVNPPDPEPNEPHDTIPQPQPEDTTLFACDALCTPNPSREAQNLYEFLRRQYGRKVISGAMAYVNWNTNEAKWVSYHTGHTPALTCFDLIQATLSDEWAKDTYSSYAVYEDWWAHNGIIAGMWHHMVPREEATETTSHNSTYKPTETTFVSANALVPGTWENAIYTRDIDRAAELLKGFRDRNIPILWRPYHEASGGWFWWGTDAAAEKAMWLYMWDRFVNYHGLNNLIWVWTTQGYDSEWYPGDQYVDMIARDIYSKTEGSSFGKYFVYDKGQHPNKMLALAECGRNNKNLATINEQWEAGAKWSYFMPWYDGKRTANATPNLINFTDTVKRHEQADIPWWREAWAQEYVLSREDMPSLK